MHVMLAQKYEISSKFPQKQTLIIGHANANMKQLSKISEALPHMNEISCKTRYFTLL